MHCRIPHICLCLLFPSKEGGFRYPICLFLPMKDTFMLKNSFSSAQLLVFLMFYCIKNSQRQYTQCCDFFFPVPSGFHGCYKPPIISTGQWFCKYFKILLLYLGVKPVFEFVSLTEGCACLTFFHPLILGASLISPSCFLRENPIPKVVQHRSCQNFLCCLSCSSVFGEDLGEFPFSWDSAPAVHMWMGLSLAFIVFSWLLFSFCQDGNCCVKPFFFLVKSRHPFCYYLPAFGTCILFIPCTQSPE